MTQKPRVSAHPCPCGRPIQDTATICPTCVETLRENLTKIADRWAELEDALTWREVVAGEKGKAKNGMVAVGTTLNEQAVNARRKATDAVWFTLQVIRDDCDDALDSAAEAFDNAARELAHRELWEDGVPEILGRLSAAVDRAAFTPPRMDVRSQNHTPALARWIAAWQLSRISHNTEPETSAEIVRDVIAAEKATFRATHPSGAHWTPVNLGCQDHGTSDQGERTPCAGAMFAYVGDDVMPDLVCSEDPTHVLKPEVWEREGWKRKHSVPMHPVGATLHPVGVGAFLRKLKGA